MVIYFTRTLQVKYITASTGELVLYLCTVIQRVRQVHTDILSGQYI